MKYALLLLNFVSFMTLASWCEDDLVVVYNGDWAPYIYRIDNQTYAGSDFELLTQTLNNMNCNLQVLPMSKRRSDMEYKKGTFDFYIGASFTHERNESFYFSIPYRNEIVSFLVDNKTHDHAKPLPRLVESGANIAINMDGYFGDSIESLKQQYPDQFIHEFSLADRLALVFQHDADIVVDDLTALCREAEKPGRENYSISMQPLHTDAIHFMLNRMTLTVEFVNAFNRSLREILEQNPDSQRSRCEVALSRLQQRE